MRDVGKSQAPRRCPLHMPGGLSCVAVAALVVAAGVADIAVAADKLSVGALRFTSHSGGFIALENGYFSEEGLDVEFRFFQAAAHSAAALAAGDIDFAVAGVTSDYMNLAAEGAIKAVGGVLREHQDFDGMAIMASMKAWEAGFTSPEQLKGKSLALTQLGSTFHYMGGVLAEQFGYSIEDIAVRPLHKVSAMIDAFRSGQVDAMFMIPHVAKPLDQIGAGKIIGWMRDYRPDHQVTVLMGSAENIRERPDLVKRFLRAYSRGMADFNRVMLDPSRDAAATEAMVELIHKYVHVSRTFANAAPSIKAGAMYFNPGASLDLESIEHQLEWHQSQGLVAETVTMEQIVDTSFVETN